MRILFCFVLIIISSFAHASDFTYQHYVFQFNKLARELKAERTLPTLDTEQGKEILNKLTDPNLFRLISKDKLDDNTGILDETLKINSNHLTFNPYSKASIDITDVTRNIKQFDSEIVLLSSFNLKFFTALLPYISESYMELPESEKIAIRVNLLKTIQTDFLIVYRGILKTVSTPDSLSNLSKQKLITVLEQSSKNFAPFLSKDKKKAFISLTEQEAKELPEYKPQITSIIQTIQESPCKYLCEITSQKRINE